MPRLRLKNDEIADVLERVADLLEAQDANAWRVRAYRAAAGTARGADRPLLDVLEQEGVPGLIRLPHVGPSISAAIEELAHTGHLRLLDRLEGEIGAERIFTTVPGIGEDLAHRIHATLAIDTLEELEAAAHDGSLERVPGFGKRRTHGVRDALATILARTGRQRARRPHPVPGTADPPQPTVAVVLDIDADYRRRALQGTLRRIAPRRFNPEGRAWLPIHHAESGGWAFTAMYSNTARAHELGTTHDWVVVFYEREDAEGRATVVTEPYGPMAGRRVVRGREAECARHYRDDASCPAED